MVMTKTELETIEETHALGYATYYSEDGSRETEVEVCTHCEESGEYQYAATFPCEVLQKAVDEWDEQEAAKETAAIPVVIFDAETGIIMAKPTDCGEKFGNGLCLACMLPIPECAEKAAHKFLTISAEGAKACGVLD
jgi:hypothetical protein